MREMSWKCQLTAFVDLQQCSLKEKHGSNKILLMDSDLQHTPEENVRDFYSRYVFIS